MAMNGTSKNPMYEERGSSQGCRKTFATIRHHSKILLRGLARTVYGTAVAGLVGLSVYGFMMIPSEGGYTAVCEFVVASLTFGMACGAMYAFGGCRKKHGRYAAK